MKYEETVKKHCVNGLVRPIDEEYMYYAAMKSKFRELTPIVIYYYQLNEN